ncbi:MAG: phytanoyl-CoA dioxygenase family protein [Armatimonadetes bacterium]|nr:phytanoyl-CoA dioxygenase family protein [Armatimonadota bacterium]
MLTQSQVASFRSQGFLQGGAVLTPEETQELRDALTRTLAGKSPKTPESLGNIGGGKGVVVQIVNEWEAEPAFRKHLSHPKIVAMVAQLMDTNTVRVWHDQVQIKPSHIGAPTIWHQDFPYWQVIQPAELVSAWVALEDATIENGCMSMVPRSHTWGQYPGGTIGIRDGDWEPTYDPARVPKGETVEVVPCEVPAGSVVFHHCLTWHGAPANYTGRGRPAIAVHYMPGHTRYEPTDFKHLVEKNITVEPGELLTGDHFPTVLEQGVLKG